MKWKTIWNCQVEGCNKPLKYKQGHYCHAHRMRMLRHGNYEINPNWNNLRKGERCLTTLGYVRINIDGVRVLEHTHIMEKYLGRKLEPHERIHHINGNKADNRIENLELFNNHSEHMKKYHARGCDTRKVNPTYKIDEIQKVLERLPFPFGSYNSCFCGNKLACRNLCEKHYQWAHKHNFIKRHV